MRIPVLAKPGAAHPDKEARHGEPLTFGVPLPRGLVKDAAGWIWVSPGAAPKPVQARVLDAWPDGSVRWALVDVQADIEAGLSGQFSIETAPSPDGAETPGAIAISESGATIGVDTSRARFRVRQAGAFPFDGVEVDGAAAMDAAESGLTITDATGVAHRATVERAEVEERGSLRSVVRVRGKVQLDGGRVLNLDARVHFYAGLRVARLLITATNPNRAEHKGGFWDLGDPGSVLLRDVSLAFGLPSGPGTAAVHASIDADDGKWSPFGTPFELYQDSSGGEHWQSANHLNRERRVPTTFRGYRLKSGDQISQGLRATPIVAISRGTTGIAVTTPHFWQNFPKAIDASGSQLIVRLFPGQFGDLHELQGGEQKTHELYVSFGPDRVTDTPLAWARSRTVAIAAPEWVLSSKAIPFLAPLEPAHAALVGAAVEGTDRFEDKRERIDEFGWRHFGELYGDHEGIRRTSPPPLVSHYNNQYDAAFGLTLQYLRTGDARWWRLASELVAHVVDIDVYHTSADKSAYNHGLFWHTYHYGEADTATHRTYPKSALGHIHGGGPSADHNYTSGLMLHYFLTGSEASRQTVIDLAQFVIDMDDGSKTVFGWLDRGNTGRAALSATGYFGPGRGPANSLNALVDGHRLSGDARFLDKAEQLIRRVIHPDENIALRRLDVPELRWFYTMFLQSLGKYLHYKADRADFDRMYSYGRASLLHYARWMAENEHPYLEEPEKLEFPTETWAAQDIRKSDIFYFAATHASGPERDRFIERARFFHRYSTSTLQEKPTRTLLRPVVVLLSSGFMQGWFGDGAQAVEPPLRAGVADGGFGSPEVFVAQRDRAKKKAILLAGAGAVAVVGLVVLLLVR